LTIKEDITDSSENEISQRLDDIFGDDDDDSFGTQKEDQAENTPSPNNDINLKAQKESPKPPQKDPVKKEKTFPLDNLKAVLLEMDWEISDQNMKNFIAEIKRLKNLYQKDKFISHYLKLHDTIGRYVASKKSNAHPGSIKFMQSIGDRLEKMIPGKVTEREKKRILSGEIKAFKELKNFISAKKNKLMAPAETLTAAIEEMKKTIMDELTKLKKEIKSLK
jgi:hypothetical protein